MKRLKGFVSTKFFLYLLLGFAVSILSAHLGLPSLWGSEGRWAVIARSMLRSKDLFSPMLGIRDYWDKPLLSYWQILPFAYANGSVSEFTARIPSVIWAVVVLFLTHSLAKRWFGRQTALLSVGLLVTSYGFIFWGRNAQVEMTNAAMILLCLWYFLKHQSDNRYRWVHVLGALMALGSNMKGIVLYAVPVFCIMLLSIIKREWSWIPPLKTFFMAGLLSLVLFIAVPIIATYHHATWEPLQMVWRENVLRFFGGYDHQGTFYTYFAKIFYLAAPWSLLFPVALIHSLRGVHRRLSQIPEALILLGAIFLFFNLSGSRRPYYLLPILPFVAILVANMLREFEVGTLGRVIQDIVRFIGLVLGLALIALFGIFLLFPQIIPAHTHSLWPLSILLASLGITTIVSTTKKYVWGMVGPVITVWLIYMIVVTPWITEGPNLKTQVAEVIALNRPCSFLYMDDARIIFYLDKPYQIFSNKARALNWATKADGVLITSSDFSDRHWECAVKGHNWQAVVPRKVPLLDDSRNLK